MGKALSGAANITGGLGGGILGSAGGGINKLLDPFGLGGGQGESFQAQTANPFLANTALRESIYRNDDVNRALENYGSGKISLQDALKALPETDYTHDELRNAIASDPFSGSKLAAEQVGNDAVLSQLYSGDNSALGRALSEEKQLGQTGYNLQAEDHDALGQAYGNIARDFGAQENNLAQALAAHGLSEAPSGAAAVQFTGMLGNKNEQLRAANMDVAQKRMQSAMERQNAVRNYIGSMGQQYGTEVNNQYDRNIAGITSKRAPALAAMTAQTQANIAANDANLKAMEDKRKAEGKTLFGAIGQGLYSGTSNLASQAPSAAVGGGPSAAPKA
jgi:hypothetical protein